MGCNVSSQPIKIITFKCQVKKGDDVVEKFYRLRHEKLELLELNKDFRSSYNEIRNSKDPILSIENCYKQSFRIINQSDLTSISKEDFVDTVLEKMTEELLKDQFKAKFVDVLDEILQFAEHLNLTFNEKSKAEEFDIIKYQLESFSFLYPQYQKSMTLLSDCFIKFKILGFRCIINNILYNSSFQPKALSLGISNLILKPLQLTNSVEVKGNPNTRKLQNYIDYFSEVINSKMLDSLNLVFEAKFDGVTDNNSVNSNNNIESSSNFTLNTEEFTILERFFLGLDLSGLRAINIMAHESITNIVELSCNKKVQETNANVTNNNQLNSTKTKKTNSAVVNGDVNSLKNGSENTRIYKHPMNIAEKLINETSNSEKLMGLNLYGVTFSLDELKRIINSFSFLGITNSKNKESQLKVLGLDIYTHYEVISENVVPVFSEKTSLNTLIIYLREPKNKSNYKEELLEYKNKLINVVDSQLRVAHFETKI